MDELMTFVHARLNELEEAARCAPGPEWWEDEKVYKWGDDAEPEICCGKGLIAKISREAPTAPEHILLNDPAHILRDVQAKRQLLGWLERQREWAAENNLWAYDDEEPLKLLALPYASHADYRKEWAL